MKNLLNKILLTANVLVIIGMLFTGFADILDPRKWSYLAIAGYAFPFFAILNIIFIGIWMLVKKLYIAAPFLAFVACYSPMMKYCPMRLSDDAPEESMKVMTYNTWSFGHSEGKDMTWEEKREVRRQMLQYIADQDCDIVCLQEVDYGSDIEHDMDSIVKPVLPYRSHKEWAGNKVMLLSKYPILKAEQIKYESRGNLSVAYYLDAKGKEFIVINNHLETNHFSTEEKENFGKMVKGGMERHEIKGESKFVARKLVDAAKIRAAQADAIATFIELHKGRSILLCGDFNDIPISYTRRTIARELTDCYVATAKGPGFSYHKHGMYVRIDNIMCSEDMISYRCHVDKTCNLSDHYPVICWVK